MPDREFYEEIADDVLKSLGRTKFFDDLDELFCPHDGASSPVSCDNSFKSTQSILPGLGYDDAAIQDIVNVLQVKGACCDCEVLYNVAETSKLKEKYWKARYEEEFKREVDPSADRAHSLTPPKAADKF